MQIFRAEQRTTHGQGSFHIERVKPGLAYANSKDPALGPLSGFDHATLGVGTVVKMHEHVNDEILSYMWKGSMLHEDKAGNIIPISRNKLMMMNAGKSFWHEESTPDEAVEMLQIFVRPREADLSGHVHFLERAEGTPVGEWGWVAGPEGSEAPLIIRNQVYVYDTVLNADQQITPVERPGLVSWLYVLDGEVTVGEHSLGKGDGVSSAQAPLPSIQAEGDSSLVLFLVDMTAPYSLAGTISGT
ncbi:pirin family protein [Pseudomonas sp. HR96]|uniref:pirin family protein n=1 Tax=Pseudomonas sp. HR96 TaxID=1027966 RepID=UPI002A74C896|nr:pirin family protein [Pseudomonas sp. HR96]WPP01970.1 pirin family protein [Pseudomonas sp. HR96]